MSRPINPIAQPTECVVRAHEYDTHCGADEAVSDDRRQHVHEHNALIESAEQLFGIDLNCDCHGITFRNNETVVIAIRVHHGPMTASQIKSDLCGLIERIPHRNRTRTVVLQEPRGSTSIERRAK